MRIGVSGTHGTGKTTLVEELCAALPGHAAAAEPYLVMEEEGYPFADPPTPGDYRAQLARSVVMLGPGDADVVFDRTPADFLAYLVAHGRSVEEEADDATHEALESAMSSLDLLVFLPVTEETERLLPGAELPGLRSVVDEALTEILHGDPLDAWGRVPILELDGPLDRRVETVLAALAGLA
ncbi:AAA family ATPase [Streptomyces sp. IBSNAI002]|uniref:AAA family ATPase n=1 Tax=Streptomyces sp. IBSNAI002 TaxID=3457500 RepID=UPI003FD36FFF